MNLDNNLEYQYEQVVFYLDAYGEFIENINRRIVWLPFRDPIGFIRIIKNFRSLWRQIDPLSGKTAEFYRDWVNKNAKEDEKQSAYYSIITSEYPTHQLSVSIELRFPDVDFEKLKKLHELKKRQIARLNVKQIVGAVLAAATVLLKSIPASVVVRIVDYKKFEFIIFAATAITLGYLLIVLMPLWVKYSRARKLHEYIGDVIEYTTIRKFNKIKGFD